MEPSEIRAMRERFGMTQAQFAARVGTTQTVVSKWENGLARPRNMAVKLLRLMDQPEPHRIAEPEPVYDAG